MSQRSINGGAWTTPIACLVVGLVLFAVFAIGGDLGDGGKALGVMAAIAIVLVVGSSRSETLAAMSGAGRDERWKSIDLRAAGFTAAVLVVAIVGCWVYEIVDGRDGSPYGQLAAIGAAAYLAALTYGRVRH